MLGPERKQSQQMKAISKRIRKAAIAAGNTYEDSRGQRIFRAELSTISCGEDAVAVVDVSSGRAEAEETYCNGVEQ